MSDPGQLLSVQEELRMIKRMNSLTRKSWNRKLTSKNSEAVSGTSVLPKRTLTMSWEANRELSQATCSTRSGMPASRQKAGTATVTRQKNLTARRPAWRRRMRRLARSLARVPGCSSSTLITGCMQRIHRRQSLTLWANSHRTRGSNPIHRVKAPGQLRKVKRESSAPLNWAMFMQNHQRLDGKSV